jgi:hypothetical protein
MIILSSTWPQTAAAILFFSFFLKTKKAFMKKYFLTIKKFKWVKPEFTWVDVNFKSSNVTVIFIHYPLMSFNAWVSIHIFVCCESTIYQLNQLCWFLRKILFYFCRRNLIGRIREFFFFNKRRIIEL